MKLRKGLTMIELLVVIGIITILLGASLGGYAKFVKTAEKTRVQELVANTATALTALFQKEGAWPKVLRSRGATDGELDDVAAYPLAAGGFMDLTMDKEGRKLSGLDRFGIITPKAMAHVKRRGTNASLADKMEDGRTLRDHILHFAIDTDGDGIIRGANVNGVSTDVRASAIVWNGEIHSWTKGQTRNIQ